MQTTVKKNCDHFHRDKIRNELIEPSQSVFIYRHLHHSKYLHNFTLSLDLLLLTRCCKFLTVVEFRTSGEKGGGGGRSPHLSGPKIEKPIFYKTSLKYETHITRWIIIVNIFANRTTKKIIQKWCL